MLMEQLKKDKMNAMRNKDTASKNALTQIIDIAEKTAKAECRDVTNEDCVKALKSSIKKANDAISMYEKASADNSAAQEKILEAKHEISVAQNYLPKEATEEQILIKVKEIAEQHGDSVSIKVLMPALKKAFGDSLNGNVAKMVIEKFLRST